MSNKYLTVPCAFHPTETITNFCHAKECQLPLCRTCICIHQRQHTNIPQPPNIGDVFLLMDKVRGEIHQQREQLRKKYPLVAKHIKNNQQQSRILYQEIEMEREQLMRAIQERYTAILNNLISSFQQRQQQLIQLHGKMETIETTLNNIEETLFRGKAMRSVIMWQSQALYKVGLETIRKLQMDLLEEA